MYGNAFAWAAGRTAGGGLSADPSWHEFCPPPPPPPPLSFLAGDLGLRLREGW